MNENDITVTLIATAGVLLEYKGKKMLIDGIHSDDRHEFSKVSDELLADMIHGKGKFNNVDYLLFTHIHIDHISPKYTMEYMNNNSIKQIFLPLDGGGKFTELKNFVQKQGVPMRLLKMPLGKRYSYMLNEDMGVTVFNALHTNEIYRDIENYCFIVTLGNKNILFTADAELDAAYYQKVLGNIKIDVLFVNPLYLNKAEGRAAIKEIHPDKVVVYHMPFIQDDHLNFRKVVKKDKEKYSSTLPEMIVLSEELQEIIL